jgi:hypothetical protein
METEYYGHPMMAQPALQQGKKVLGDNLKLCIQSSIGTVCHEPKVQWRIV